MSKKREVEQVLAYDGGGTATCLWPGYSCLATWESKALISDLAA
jgi:hypothetical protein